MQLRAKAAMYMARNLAVAAVGVDCQALPDGATVEAGDSDYEPDARVNCGDTMADYFRVASVAHDLTM